MTPLQLQKYSDYKKKFKKDIIIFDKYPKAKRESLSEKISLIKKKTSRWEMVKISKGLQVFFYNE